MQSGSTVFGLRPWAHAAIWLAAWNAFVPIRLGRMLLDPERPPGYLWPVIEGLVLDQTTWAVVTYVMFRLALRASREPLRRVLAVLAVLCVPLMALRLWGATVLGAPGPHWDMGLIWFVFPLQLFPLIAAAALGLLVVSVQRERDGAVLRATLQAERATLQAELASARLQTLQLQLNPHFLFNALNSIASLVSTDMTKAEAAIDALASFLRASLSASRGEETTLEEELALVDAYLEIEMLRFEWLTVDIDVPVALRSACIPAFVLQLLVENAIRHGLAPRRRPGRVLVVARRDGGRLQLCVSDDGVGPGSPSGRESLGIGLQNVRARLAQLHGTEGTLTLESAAPEGTVATIRIPYRACLPDPTPSAGDA